MAILVVEEDNDHLLLLKRALSRSGFSKAVLAVPDGAHAIAFLKGEGEFAHRDKHPLPRIVILNWNLPLLHGRDVLKWIGEQGPEIRSIPVIVLTGDDLDRVNRQAMASGAKICLVKPLDKDGVGKLCQVLDGSCPQGRCNLALPDKSSDA